MHTDYSHEHLPAPMHTHTYPPTHISNSLSFIHALTHSHGLRVQRRLPLVSALLSDATASGATHAHQTKIFPHACNRVDGRLVAGVLLRARRHAWPGLPGDQELHAVSGGASAETRMLSSLDLVAIKQIHFLKFVFRSEVFK